MWNIRTEHLIKYGFFQFPRQDGGLSRAKAAWLKAAREQQPELIFLPKPREISLRPLDEYLALQWQQSQGKTEKSNIANCTEGNMPVVKALNKLQPVKCGKYSWVKKET